MITRKELIQLCREWIPRYSLTRGPFRVGRVGNAVRRAADASSCPGAWWTLFRLLRPRLPAPRNEQVFYLVPSYH